MNSKFLSVLALGTLMLASCGDKTAEEESKAPIVNISKGEAPETWSPDGMGDMQMGDFVRTDSIIEQKEAEGETAEESAPAAQPAAASAPAPAAQAPEPAPQTED